MLRLEANFSLFKVSERERQKMRVKPDNVQHIYFEIVRVNFSSANYFRNHTIIREENGKQKEFF